MERWQGKVALITGASAGIGYVLAKQLIEFGMNVVGCARNTAAIEVRTKRAVSHSVDWNTGLTFDPKILI